MITVMEILFAAAAVSFVIAAAAGAGYYLGRTSKSRTRKIRTSRPAAAQQTERQRKEAEQFRRDLQNMLTYDGSEQQGNV